MKWEIGQQKKKDGGRQKKRAEERHWQATELRNNSRKRTFRQRNCNDYSYADVNPSAIVTVNAIALVIAVVVFDVAAAPVCTAVAVVIAAATPSVQVE